MRLCSLLGIKYPIIQAPMAGSDNAAMVAAACDAGVLGSLGAQYRTPQDIAAAIRDIRATTNGSFGVNLFALPASLAPGVDQINNARQALESEYKRFNVDAPDDHLVVSQISADEQLEVLLGERVPVFSFTLGMPSFRWIERFKAAGTIVIGTATNVAEARALAAAKVDAIVVQGSEAGGHRGTFVGAYENSMTGLMALIPQVADEVEIPVIAAGGIVDGRGIAAAFALGADGVQMGTAFLGANECPVHDNYKNLIMSERANETAITKVFSGGAARGITNEFMKNHADSPLLPFPFQNALTRPIRNIANKKGDIENTNLWCGQAGKLVRRQSTAKLVQNLTDETAAAIDGLKEIQRALAGAAGVRNDVDCD